MRNPPPAAPVVFAMLVIAAAVGAAPMISVSPSSIAFGGFLVGSGSNQGAMVSNAGTGTLTVTGFTFTGSTSSFSLVSPPATPFALGAGASVPLTVRFAPASTGLKNATLTISNDSGVAGAITLSGTGLAPGAPGIDTARAALMALLLMAVAVPAIRRRHLRG